MSCGCDKPERTSLWTPIPEFRQPTEIQVGENIDCYMKRTGSPSGLKNDVGEKMVDRIDNTTLTSDLNQKVDTTFILSPGSTKYAASWVITVNGGPDNNLAPLTELTWSPTTGKLSGTVAAANLNKNYKVMITAKDASGGIIDAREFNFYPKTVDKDGTIKFVMPLDGDIRVTCGFGPRKPPVTGASSAHQGMDFARKDHSQGNILAAADGTVVRCGPGSGWGNVIFIEHNDAYGRLVCTTVYGHWAKSFVKEGQKVSAGQKIALEGNVGIGSGMHLHFEMHKGKFRNPIDPAPYLNGALEVAVNNDPNSTGPDGTPKPTNFTTQNNKNAGMTTGETQNANADCPTVLPQDKALPPIDPANEKDPTIPANNTNKYRSVCAPESGTPTSQQVVAIIQQACADAGLTAEETRFIQTVATIESGLDPYAKNPTSSAMGLYQFLDATATSFFGKLGIPATCANRCDPYKATQAMILFYKKAFKPYWEEYKSKGTIANKTPASNEWTAQYPKFTSGEFMYGLIHHDGVGNAVAGKDLQGVAYWRKKVKTA